jgi:glycine cleavage system H protein
MSDPLVFMMGKFEARFPTDRRYAKNHMWALAAEDGYRFGFSGYAIRLLQDVYFLDWTIDAGTTLRMRQTIGAIESSKAESDLYAPISGRLEQFNKEVLGDPALINVEPYDRGWLFAMTGDDAELLSPDDYLVHLAAAWKIAERTIKGQMNE